MEIIKISKGQYLNEVLLALLTNTIYFKTLTGIGATTLEIETERNSIILEPNVPVIKGKRKKDILCIYEKVGVDQVANYLKSKHKCKKLLVTPESFWKILEAAKLLEINLVEDYFLLYDECDRTIKDVAFRPKILLPMEEFFKFKNKAFISATAILPSDPRFTEQGFKAVKIIADYKIDKPINLISTNNIFLALKQTLKEIDNDNICIFINSTNLIGSIIKTLGLNNESVVYCSRESAQQLAISGIKKVYDNLAEFQKYTFFTSRFFSAVDIIMETKPTIIMLTDFKTATHTMIDPYCDATQIIGRFRKGYKEVYHISNFDSTLKSMNKNEVMAYLNGCETSYNDIKALKAATLNQGSKDTLEAALKLVPFANFINEGGSKNYFMVDNMILDEKVKHTYLNTSNFQVDYKELGYNPSFKEELFPLSDKAHLKVKAGINTIDVVKSVIEAIKTLNDPLILFSISNKDLVMQELNRSHPLIVAGLEILGEEGLLKNGYSQKQIKRAINEKQRKSDTEHFGFLKYLQSEIIDGETYTAVQLNRIFEKGIRDHGLSIKPKLSNIREIFDLRRRTTRDNTGKEIKVYLVLRCRLNR